MKGGKKMSKSLGNIVNPFDVFDAVGADPLRWHFAARVRPPTCKKRVSVDIVSGVASSFINTYWNTYAFFVMYANSTASTSGSSRATPIVPSRSLDHRRAGGNYS